MNMSHDIQVVSRLGTTLRILKFLEMALTVVIIAFTVLRMINIFREQN
jgi:hypothetical protein